VSQLKIQRRATLFLKNEDGVSAIEFAILAPIFVLILIAIIEFGSAILIRLELNSRISSIANFLTISGLNISNETAFENALIGLLDRNTAPFIREINLDVNNSVLVQSVAGAVNISGTGESISSCYCPSINDSGFTWGSGTPCNSQCSSGALSGRYIRVSMDGRQFSLFGRFLPQDTTSTVTSLVKVR
jgi:Flp pilus assembly pilin Flp